MQTITIRNLSFAYPGQQALFTDCQLDLSSDWRLGLLGRNRRGKTTLLRILLDQLSYRGTVTSKLSFSYFPLSISDPQAFTLDALLASQAGAGLAQWQIERELGLMGGDPALLWQPYASLSGGEQTKVQLATLFAAGQDFPLLDEPTNHLDQAGRQQVAAYLLQKGRGFIITSHDQDFLDQVVDHTLVIERHQLVLNQGNYSSYFRQKTRRDQTALATNHRLEGEIKALHRTRQQRLQWAQRAEGEKKYNAHADKGFIGAKAAKMMKKTINTSHRLSRAIDQRKGLLQEVEKIVPLTINYQPGHQQAVLSCDRVSLSIAGRALCRPVSFTLRQHEQLALCGPNGAGKSSLIRAITGRFPGQVGGQIHTSVANISVVRQNYLDQHGSLANFAARNSLPYDELLNLLRKLGMDRASFTVPIDQLSRGQQKKVELARSLLTPASLYIWDEPLNYLDTYNQQQLITLIREYRPTLLFVEHDRHFIESIASRQIPVVPLPR